MNQALDLFFTGADNTEPFIDVKDAQWSVSHGQLTPVRLEQLSHDAALKYNYGLHILQLLQKTFQGPDITLLLASAIPSNDFTHNAYRHSFFYQSERRILWIRLDQLEKIGNFVILLLHCYGHILTGDLANDMNAGFIKYFYKVSGTRTHYSGQQWPRIE
jgi:hypothetical protein